MAEKKISEGYQPGNLRNDGYQPSYSSEQRGYQPQPNGNFGYQPLNKSLNPPSPPSTGSNAAMPKK